MFHTQMKDSNNAEITIILKISKVEVDNSTSAEAAKKDLTKEMPATHSLDHHNIVKLIGVSDVKPILQVIPQEQLHTQQNSTVTGEETEIKGERESEEDKYPCID